MVNHEVSRVHRKNYDFSQNAYNNEAKTASFYSSKKYLYNIE